MKTKTTVIYHSADFDGLFCREIARKFLPEAELIGWDFADAPLAIPPEGTIYILDLPVDRVFGGAFHASGAAGVYLGDDVTSRIIWIDHHKSSIDTHPANLPGYRIDGVAACRLAWHWFTNPEGQADSKLLASKQHFIDRAVREPYAVQLAGEYDIWDKRNPDAEVFQFGLRASEVSEHVWAMMLSNEIAPPLRGTGMDRTDSALMVEAILEEGRILQRYQQEQDASIVKRLTFLVEFEGLKFLALNSPRFNSLTFAAVDVPESGHDALMGFRWDGKTWTVSLYHAKHNTGIDLSVIAQKFGGGGHRGACGFQIGNRNYPITLPFSV